jgi:hypothetical protein
VRLEGGVCGSDWGYARPLGELGPLLLMDCAWESNYCTMKPSGHIEARCINMRHADQRKQQLEDQVKQLEARDARLQSYAAKQAGK